MGNIRSPRVPGRWSMVVFLLLLSTKLTVGQTELDKTSDRIQAISALSDLVLVGCVVKNQSRWAGKVIVTTSRIELVQYLKGDAGKGDFQVSFFGGTASPSARQIMLLFSDGMHNRPVGTSVLDAEPLVAANEVTSYSVGYGTSINVAELSQIVDNSGGYFINGSVETLYSTP